MFLHLLHKYPDSGLHTSLHWVTTKFSENRLVFDHENSRQASHAQAAAQVNEHAEQDTLKRYLQNKGHT